MSCIAASQYINEINELIQLYKSSLESRVTGHLSDIHTHKYIERALKATYKNYRYCICPKTKSEREALAEIDSFIFKTYYDQSGIKGRLRALRYKYPQLGKYYSLLKKLESSFKAIFKEMRALPSFYKIKKGMKDKKYILFLTPSHGNLGDQAIILAEKEFIVGCVGKEDVFYEITDAEFGNVKKWLNLCPLDNKDILVQGGGFLGALWPGAEENFRSIVRAFPKNRIIVFPQTITFDMETNVGRRFFEESKKIYESHPDLTIFVRESQSYAFMNKYMPEVKCFLVPDIVTVLSYTPNTYQRRGILVCRRSDLEKAINDESMAELENVLKKRFPDDPIEYTDTVLHKKISPDARKQEVYDKLDQFAHAKLIITDRLHGMLMAMLAGTPCLALNNSNGKVQAVYEWIKEVPYVKFVPSVEQLGDFLDGLDLTKQYKYDKKFISPKFELLSTFFKSE